MRLSDDVITYVFGFVTLFVFVSGQERIATFYMLMLLFEAYFTGRDDDVRLPFERSSGGWIQSLLTAAGAYVVYISLVPVAVTSILGIKLLINETGILQMTQAMLPDLIIEAPLFAILTKAVFGMQETRFFFARSIEFIADQMNLPLDFSQRAWTNYLLIGFLPFVLFHIFIKKTIELTTGLNVGLIGTGIFAVVSIILVIYTRQQREAVILHGGTNAIAEFLQLKAKGIITGIKDLI